MAQVLLAYPVLQLKFTVEPRVKVPGRTSLPLAGSPGKVHALAGDNRAPVSSQLSFLAGKPKTPPVLSQGMDQRPPDLPSNPKLFHDPRCWPGLPRELLPLGFTVSHDSASSQLKDSPSAGQVPF